MATLPESYVYAFGQDGSLHARVLGQDAAATPDPSTKIGGCSVDHMLNRPCAIKMRKTTQINLCQINHLLHWSLKHHP